MQKKKGSVGPKNDFINLKNIKNEYISNSDFINPCCND